MTVVHTYDPETGLDPHWSPEHPDFDPDCSCGSPQKVLHSSANPDDGPPVGFGNGKRTASPKAVSFLRKLVDRADSRVPVSIVAAARAAIEANDPADVSDAIDALKEALEAAKPKRRNRYGGACHRCGAWIAAEDGLLVKPNGAWAVEHDGDCPTVVAEIETTETVVSGPDLSALPSGRYAVPGGDTRLKLKVDNLILDTPRNPKWSGWVFVKDAAEYGAGRRYGAQRPGGRYDGDVIDELEAILADPHAAIAEYGKLTGTCGVCGRHLEDETSIALGIGPICRKKFL